MSPISGHGKAQIYPAKVLNKNDDKIFEHTANLRTSAIRAASQLAIFSNPFLRGSLTLAA